MPSRDGDLLSFLEDPSSYPHGPDRVEVLQTHISYVALAGPYVFKVKKPLDLGFLDFSTLELRRHFCNEEVRLNRRLCAEIYEAVVPITRTGGRLVFEGPGEPVEYAVRMKKLADGRFMHQMLDRGELRPDDLDRVAARLVDFYSGQRRSSEIAEWGRIDRLRVSTDENFGQTEGHVGTLLSRPAFEALRFYVGRFFDCHAGLFASRRARGHIVDGHGDLRLEHIHLTASRVCIFDCIEFNDRFRYIDIASDVAFLAMDLDSCRPDMARHVARRIAERLEDPDLLTLLDFYKCYRAYVRGKVEGIRSGEDEVPLAERRSSRREARRHYQLALSYAVAGSHPMVLVVMGGVGTGKTTQARALGQALGWPVYSSDRLRKEAAGVDPHERPDAETRESLYSREMTDRVYRLLADHALDRVRADAHVILDATYSLAAHRAELRRALERDGIPYRFVEITATDETVRRRLSERGERGDELSDARLEDLKALQERFEPPGALEDRHHTTVLSEGDEGDTTLSILREMIRRQPSC